MNPARKDLEPLRNKMNRTALGLGFTTMIDRRIQERGVYDGVPTYSMKRLTGGYSDVRRAAWFIGECLESKAPLSPSQIKHMQVEMSLLTKWQKEILGRLVPLHEHHPEARKLITSVMMEQTQIERRFSLGSLVTFGKMVSSVQDQIASMQKVLKGLPQLPSDNHGWTADTAWMAATPPSGKGWTEEAVKAAYPAATP